MKVRRSRELSAPVADVWRIVGDPHHLPRWWPTTQRVESVSKAGWTSVFVTGRGRTVRADYSVVTTEPRSRFRWRQDLEGTPFARLFASVDYELQMAPVDGREGATRVELEVDQTSRGFARFGFLQLRRAARRQLDGALGGLAEVVE